MITTSNLLSEAEHLSSYLGHLLLLDTSALLHLKVCTQIKATAVSVYLGGCNMIANDEASICYS